MESKLLIGGKTIIDHTNEQQKMLAIKRQEIAEQVYKSLFIISPLKVTFKVSFVSCWQVRQEREIQQQMVLQDEETLEMKETFSSLQQEVELKTKKLKRVG